MKTDQLTFTRFLAAFAILVYHANGDIFPFNLHFLHQVFEKGYVFVSYFFILSGFVMVIAYGKNKEETIDSKQYYVNRFARIYPVYFLAMIACAAMQVRLYGINYENLLLTTFAIQSWFPGHALRYNTPGWSLAVEGLFYIIFPFLLNYVYRKISIKTISFVVIAIWLMTQIVFNYSINTPFYKGYPSNSHELLFYFPLMHLNEFLVGNLLGYAYLGMNKRTWNFDLAILGLLVLLFLALFYVNSLNFHDGLMAVVFAPLILLMALNNGRISTAFSNKYLIILGEISFSMYILQQPVSKLFYFFFSKIHLENHNLQFYIFVMVLIVISFLCYYLFEIPAKSWIKRLGSLSTIPTKPVVTDKVNF